MRRPGERTPMSSDYYIAVPSYKRVGQVRVFDILPQAHVWVPQSQYDAYAAEYGAERVVAVPDDQDGSIVKKRNYILDHSPCSHLLMVDDDVYGIGRWEEAKHSRLNVEEAEWLIRMGFRMAEEAQVVFWGINQLMDGRAYRLMQPIKFLAPFLGPWQGHLLEHGLRFDPEMGAKEDYDFFLQVIRKYRKALRFDKYHYLKGEGKTGGIHAQRTLARENAWIAAITRKWGRNIIKYDGNKKNLLDGRVSILIPGV
jgi:hypothetical protein